MSATAAAAMWIRPISTTLIENQPVKPRVHNNISRQRLRFYPSKSFPKYKDIRSLSSMAEPSRIRAGNGEGGVRAFEREAFINGSQTFEANGFEVTLNNLSKWIVTAIFCAILFWRHDAEALWAAMGSVINAGLSTILKRILNQERPVANLRSDPGMPSSHAQSIFYTVTFAVLSIVQWLGLNGLTAGFSGLIVAFGSYFSWLRVSQKLHTVNQVLVGALVGSIFSILWFWSWESVVLKAFVSYLWVRVVVVLGAAGFGVGFALYVIRYWVIETVTSYINRKL